MYKYFNKIEITSYLKLLLIIETVVIIFCANYISIDHQDDWILSGLEIPYIIFTISYIAFITFGSSRPPGSVSTKNALKVPPSPNLSEYSNNASISYQSHQHYRFGDSDPHLQFGSFLAVRTPDPNLCCHHHADGDKEHRGLTTLVV